MMMDYVKLSHEIFISAENGTLTPEDLSKYTFMFDLCDHQHPFSHGIRHVKVGDRAFGVRRCYYCDNRISFVEIKMENFAPDLIGVPYDLTPDRIEQWVFMEDEHPFKDAVDWNYFQKTGRRRLRWNSQR
jgi:hypothetical protein